MKIRTTSAGMYITNARMFVLNGGCVPNEPGVRCYFLHIHVIMALEFNLCSYATIETNMPNLYMYAVNGLSCFINTMVNAKEATPNHVAQNMYAWLQASQRT